MKHQNQQDAEAAIFCFSTMCKLSATTINDPTHYKTVNDVGNQLLNILIWEGELKPDPRRTLMCHQLKDRFKWWGLMRYGGRWEDKLFDYYNYVDSLCDTITEFTSSIGGDEARQLLLEAFMENGEH